MRTLVFNGWASGPEMWEAARFPRERVFSYVDQLDGLPEAEMERSGDAILVGFSMGGSTALRMLLGWPGKVRGLVLVSTTPCMMERKAEGWRAMSERRLAALRMGTLISIPEMHVASELFDEAQLDRGLEYLRSTDLRRRLLDFARGDAGRRFSSSPVEVVQSVRDGIVRPSNAEFLKSVFPQARVTMVPGGEHSLPATVPDLVARAVIGCQVAAAGGTEGKECCGHEA